MRSLVVILCTMWCCNSYGQTHYCPVYSYSGSPLKFETWFVVSDSSVQIKSMAKGQLQVMNYNIVASLNRYPIYFTDGVMTTSLSQVDQSGVVKGIKYDHTLAMKQDMKQGGSTIVFYCSKIE